MLQQFSCRVDKGFNAAFFIAPNFSNTHNRLKGSLAVWYVEAQQGSNFVGTYKKEVL